ncbi:lipid A oxidase [Rhizobium sp. RU20A]|uniref:outer membrane protein n=1 Tax=Rhizobium sp. RU20A TaxID=1907412 RepID=UPI0009565305|nr:outer membrane beta-barrel protein [Rhizobium sp. RU20A]SIR06245.1 lipid A oxidase [Rhizobium sp. RU20A]
MRAIALSAAFLATSMVTVSPAHAEDVQLSVYGGYQTAPHSGVTTSDGTHFTAGWDGKSFANPPYYGARATWWLGSFGEPDVGLSIDFTHAKVYAGGDTFAKTPGWTHFEFTDGLNLLTLNALYRFTEPGRAWTPYVGLGAGINIPHVEVTRPSGRTFGYQVGGATLQAQAGVTYAITDNWSVFTEYKGNYSWVNVDIDSGAKLKTNILTNAVNVGVSYHF